MTVKRKDFQKIATTIHQFLLKLSDTNECAELRDSLNMALLQLQKYYRRCQQRLQHTGRHNLEQNTSGYVSPRQSLRITLSRTSEALSPMTPYIEEPQYFHAHWTNLDEDAEQIRRSFSQENINPRRSLNTPPVHYAASKADLEMLNDLLKEKRDILEDQDCIGRTPLMYAVYFNHITAVHWLLTNGADPNSCDLSEITSLHWACFKGYVDMIELLIEAGANINYQDSFGRSATHWACTCPTSEPLQLLLKFEPKVNLHDRNGLTPSMWACRLDHLSYLNLLLQTKNQEVDHIDGYERDRNGRTIVHWSIRRQQPLECLKNLLNEQTVQLKDDEGKTVMLLAAEQGALETCKVIIERFGSLYIEDVDDNDRTSLLLATYGGHGEVVNFLLENGANLKAKDKTGASCMDIARNQYLFYCQLIISSHIRELEKKREPVRNDCVELIEKVNSRHNSLSEPRSLVKTPPRPPLSSKSSYTEGNKSPTLKRRSLKCNRQHYIENDDEISNGFNVTSSAFLRTQHTNSEQNEIQNKENKNEKNVDATTALFNHETIKYREYECMDVLDNETEQQYHSSDNYINIQQPVENQPFDDNRINDLNSKSKHFHRAKNVNRFNENETNKSSNNSRETLKNSQEVPIQSPVLEEESKDIQKTNHQLSKHDDSVLQKSSNSDASPKINYGAFLEPITKSFSIESSTRRKKKRVKEHQVTTKSQDRLKSLNFNKNISDQDLASSRSLDNVSNKLIMLPNGMIAKRLNSTTELSSQTSLSHLKSSSAFPREIQGKDQKDLENGRGNNRRTEVSKNNWLKNGTSNY